MADWASRKKRIWSLATLVVIALCVGVPTYLALYKKPTCFDKTKNGDERGVDCGGSCTRLCSADFNNPVHLWAKYSKVATSTYNLIAVSENPNISAETKQAEYSFRLYDDKGLLILEKTGSTPVPSGKKFAVFERGVFTGEKVPVKIFFEWKGAIEWVPVTEEILYKLANVKYDVDSGFSRVSGTIKNQKRIEYSNLESIAITYDEVGNAIDFSRTIIDFLPVEGSADVIFTWPRLFPVEPSRIEILVRSRT